MRQCEKSYILYPPDQIGMMGEKLPSQPIGTVRLSLSYLSEKESESEGIERSRINLCGIARRECSPLGGFSRGMKLVSGKTSLTVCSARCEGRIWVLRLERIISGGD